MGWLGRHDGATIVIPIAKVMAYCLSNAVLCDKKFVDMDAQKSYAMRTKGVVIESRLGLHTGSDRLASTGRVVQGRTAG